MTASLRPKPLHGAPATLAPSSRQPRFITAAVAAARDALGTLEPGCRLIGLTKGQFSLIQLLQAVLEQTGPADVTISTWSTGIRDVDSVAWLRSTELIRRCRLLLDYSFPHMRAGRNNATAVLQAFRVDEVRVARNHAKFVLVQNEFWNIAIRSSMNLNRNARLEQFDLDDSREICNFIGSVVDEVFEQMPAELEASMDDVNRVFAAALGGGTSDVYRLSVDGEGPDAALSDLLSQLHE